MVNGIRSELSREENKYLLY